MIKIAAILPVAFAFLHCNVATAAQIDLQRNQSIAIDGVLYPVSGKPLVLPNMEALLNAFATPQSEVNAVANLGSQSKVQVIVVDPMVTANADALEYARSENQRDIARLQSAIAANGELSEDLAAHSIDVAAVMAAEVAADGVLVLYAMA